MKETYRPEIDNTPELDDELATRYQHLIGVLRWAVELGRIDIYIEVAMLSAHNALPRHGHLQALYEIFTYLKKHENSTLVLDHYYMDLDEVKLFPEDPYLKECYPDAVEEVPPNAPEPLGKPIEITCYVDADHAGNLVNRRSQTGILIFCNRAPIIWYSKCQNTVETSTFGSEFVAARTATEMIQGLRYKLRMFGVPVSGFARVFIDNQSVVTNSTQAHSTLQKKHCSICYHRVREAIASDMMRVAKIHTTKNLADIFTKPLPVPTRKRLLQQILFYVLKSVGGTSKISRST